jgi:phage shock protein E
MSKQSFYINFITRTTITMFGIFKNMFAPKSNSELIVAVKSGAFLVDVRTPAEFSSGNVKGSTNIPLDEVSSQLAKFKNKENIVVFCRSGNRSSKAKSILEQNGFLNVINGGTWEIVNQVLNK